MGGGGPFNFPFLSLYGYSKQPMQTPTTTLLILIKFSLGRYTSIEIKKYIFYFMFCFLTSHACLLENSQIAKNVNAFIWVFNIFIIFIKQ